MGVSDELLWLLHQMRGTTSPIERLKLLARGWRSVRELSADDRRSLARELGFDGAEQMIDHLARRGGMSPSNLLSVLHRAEETDPATAMDEIRGLIDPERRHEAAVVPSVVDDQARLLPLRGEVPGELPEPHPAHVIEVEIADLPPAHLVHVGAVLADPGGIADDGVAPDRLHDDAARPLDLRGVVHRQLHLLAGPVRQAPQVVFPLHQGLAVHRHQPCPRLDLEVGAQAKINRLQPLGGRRTVAGQAFG